MIRRSKPLASPTIKTAVSTKQKPRPTWVRHWYFSALSSPDVSALSAAHPQGQGTAPTASYASPGPSCCSARVQPLPCHVPTTCLHTLSFVLMTVSCACACLRRRRTLFRHGRRCDGEMALTNSSKPRTNLDGCNTTSMSHGPPLCARTTAESHPMRVPTGTTAFARYHSVMFLKKPTNSS